MMDRNIYFVNVFLLTLLTACSGTGSLNTVDQNLNKDLNQIEPISEYSGPGVKRSIVAISKDIYRFFDNNHSSLFMVTDEGVLFIDPLNVNAAKWVNDEINRRFSENVTHVLYSHGHQDHASGAAMFGDVEIISHANTFDVITPASDQALIHGYNNYDKDNDGVIQKAEAEGELISLFETIDVNSNGVLTGQETETYFNKDVVPPTQTYKTSIHTVELGGKKVEMHYVGGNHAADMSYIFFPEESLVFYVDVISLRAIPFGPLPWYSKQDSENTFTTALAIDADIVVPSHGPIGTQDDVRELQQYMADLRQGVMLKIEQGLSLEEIQMTLDMQKYAHFDYYDQRLPLNIQGMYQSLIEERAEN